MVSYVTNDLRATQRVRGNHYMHKEILQLHIPKIVRF